MTLVMQLLPWHRVPWHFFGSSRTFTSLSCRHISHDLGHAFLCPLLNRIPPGLLPWHRVPWQLRLLRDLRKPCDPGTHRCRFNLGVLWHTLHSLGPRSELLICITATVLIYTPTQRLAFRAMECDEDTLDAIHTTIARSYLDLEVMMDEFYTESSFATSLPYALLH